MKTQFRATSLVIVLLSMLWCGAAKADALAGFKDITVVGDAIVSLRYGGTEYIVANGDLMLGTTTRWYIPVATGVPTLWGDGTPTPAATTTAGAPPKPEDPGSEGDNFLFRLNGANNMSSIDAINFQETIFPLPTNTIFVFERGGNDTGTYQAILEDGSLGPAVAFVTTANGGPYANTGIDVAGQNAFGVVFTTDVPVKGVRITAPGHDCLSISAIPKRADPRQSRDPQPEDGATDVARDVVLSWTPGEGAAATNGHIVYLSKNFTDVNDGMGGVTYSAASYDPGRLDLGGTYFWRVDEVGAAPGSAVFKGDVWSFTIEPVSYPLENVTATASSAEAGMGPENTVNGSGLNDSDEHSTDALHMWLSSGVQPNWILFQFDQARKLDEMWVWNSNQLVEKMVGFGAKDVTIEYSADGATWTELANVPPLEQADGADGYIPDTPIDFGGVLAKYVRLTVNSTWGGLARCSLSEVRFFYIPVQARGPVPADGATGVDLDATLSWRPGREAASHKVYFGRDRNTVANGTAPVITTADHSFDPATLEYGATYHWRIDEVNEAMVPPVYEGPVWSFTTVEYRVVDDFESYNDEENKGTRIYETWIDGITNGTTSVVGNWDPPFCEQTIVHSGKQSMPLDYNNVNSPYYAEADLPLAPPQNWTVNGLADLTLYVHGRPASFAELPDGAISMSGAGTDIWATADEFRYAFKTLAGDGSMVARVVARGPGSNTWAKGGVMIRDGVEPGSTHAFMPITGSGGNGASFQRRLATAGASTNDDVPAGSAIVPPYWVKIERKGNDFSGSISPDGIAWTQLGTAQTITMTAPVHIGLAVTSHAPDELRGYLFDSVSTTGNVTGNWTVADIGVAQDKGNSRGDLYVTLTDSANKTATVKNPDAGAVLSLGWTEWKIPLSGFTGVNLTKVKQLTIGIGDKTPDGGGRIYIDDIRLLPAVSVVPQAVTLTVGPAGNVSATGNDGVILSIDGIDVSELVLGTTTADFEKYAADHPAAHADDFNLGTYASLDEANVITVKFAVPVSTIFIIERGGNDSGFIRPLDAAGKPVGDPQPFATANWFKPGVTVGGQAAGAIVITSSEPIFGATLLPVTGAITGIDPASVSGVPAK